MSDVAEQFRKRQAERNDRDSELNRPLGSHGQHIVLAESDLNILLPIVRAAEDVPEVLRHAAEQSRLVTPPLHDDACAYWEADGVGFEVYSRLHTALDAAAQVLKETP